MEELVDARTAFIKPNEKILSHALVGMMDRTLLSDLVPEEVKQHQNMICTKSIDATALLGPCWTLRCALFVDWLIFAKSTHFGLLCKAGRTYLAPSQYSMRNMLSQSASLLRKYARILGSNLQVGS